MLTIQDNNIQDNGNAATNKATKLRRLPLSQRQDNIVVVNSTTANSTSKPNKPLAAMVTRKNSIRKLSTNDSTQENIPKGSSHETTSKIMPLDGSSSSAFAAELSNDMRPSIFRQMADYDDRDGMMVLKRANPVYDSDDDYEDDIHPKKQRTSGEPTTLFMGGQLQESCNGFDLMGLFQK